MAWQFNQREPVFLQIANRLRGDIICGVYSPDEQVPSVRQMASIAGVNPNTMQKALSLLEEEGILYSKGTLGRFVTADGNILADSKEKMRRDTVRNMLLEARALGITEKELIKYLEEEARQK